MIEQRRWERQRENDLALMQRVADEHDAEINRLDEKIVEQREELRRNTATFEEWRTYIHELETELGRPLAGSAEAIAAEAGGQGEGERPSPATGPSEPRA